ncbi:hypothetical protein H072_177 [Dactylellina haptotyla CBS 200.50]|uniref:Uncharacterized protein n=1 Tax=Dactylellina haptotyla (strain CBS 200.50) TaxID=1284197 RepID=S8AXL5_DACHA|nr:hypothetical protein H072_177 [Dactylellina haptotyla CBS 200.50]
MVKRSGQTYENTVASRQRDGYASWQAQGQDIDYPDISEKNFETRHVHANEIPKRVPLPGLRYTIPMPPTPRPFDTPNNNRWLDAVSTMISDALWIVFSFSRKLLTLVIALAIAAGVTWGTVVVFRAFAMQKICGLPLIHTTGICAYGFQKPQVPDFKNVYKTQSKLADVQRISAQSAALPSALKDGKMAMADIEIAIANSNIPGKEEMARHLNDFMRLAQPSIQSLMRYHADTNQAVDFALGLNHWARRSLQTIETKRASTVSRSMGAVVAYISGQSDVGAIQKVYLQYTKELRGEMVSIIKQGESLYEDLYRLQDKLKTVAISINREQGTAVEQREEMDTFWAWLFQMHREELGQVEGQLRLMSGLMGNINLARKITEDSTNKLVSINVEVESLWKALARPGAQLSLDDADIGYCISQIGTVINALESGQKRLAQEKQKYIS